MKFKIILFLFLSMISCKSVKVDTYSSKITDSDCRISLYLGDNNRYELLLDGYFYPSGSSGYYQIFDSILMLYNDFRKASCSFELYPFNVKIDSFASLGLFPINYGLFNARDSNGINTFSPKYPYYFKYKDKLYKHQYKSDGFQEEIIDLEGNRENRLEKKQFFNVGDSIQLIDSMFDYSLQVVFNKDFNHYAICPNTNMNFNSFYHQFLYDSIGFKIHKDEFELIELNGRKVDGDLSKLFEIKFGLSECTIKKLSMNVRLTRTGTKIYPNPRRFAIVK